MAEGASPRPRAAGNHEGLPRGTVANDHIDLDLRRGEVHALLGENGAGKTTLMNILYGLSKPDEGEILLNGERITFSSPKDAIERGIGMVHQHFMLIPVMTVAENIVLGDRAERQGLPRLRRRTRARARAGADVRLPDRSRRADRGHRRRPAAARRDPEGALPQRRHPDPRRADGGADAAGGDRVLRDPRDAEARGHLDHLHQPQAERSARDRRPRDGAAPRQEDRDAADARARRRSRWPARWSAARCSCASTRPPAEPGDVLLEVEDLHVLDDREIEKVRRRLADRARGRDRRHRGRRRQRADRADRRDHGPAARSRAGRCASRARSSGTRARATCSRPASARSRRTASGAGWCSSSRSPRTSRCTTSARRRTRGFGWLLPAAPGREGAHADPRVRRARRRARDAGGRALGRQPAEGDPRARDRPRPEGADRGAADARPRRRRDRVRAPAADRGARRRAGRSCSSRSSSRRSSRSRTGSSSCSRARSWASTRRR